MGTKGRLRTLDPRPRSYMLSDLEADCFMYRSKSPHWYVRTNWALWSEYMSLLPHPFDKSQHTD